MSNSKAGPTKAAHRAGDMDVEFNGDGYLRSPFPVHIPDPRSESCQRFYPIANSPAHTIESVMAARLSNGPGDPSFGVAGVYTFPRMDDAIDTFMDSQGFIFRTDTEEATITCVGVSEFLNEEIDAYVNIPAAVRITASGQLDTTFGDGGKQLDKWADQAHSELERNSPNSKSAVASVAMADLKSDAAREFTSPWTSVRSTVQSQDGGILFPCRLTNNSVHVFCMVKILPDGKPDANHGVNGVKQIQSSPSADDWMDYAADDSGGITIVGRTTVSGRTVGLVSRYKASGELDAVFAGGTKVIDLPEAQGVTITQVFSGDEGNTTLCVYVNDSAESDYRIVIIKLLANGEYDPEFNSGQPLVVNDVASFPVVLMGVDNQQRLVVSHSVLTADAKYTRLTRWLKDGVLDVGFGVNGSVDHADIANAVDLFIQDGVDIMMKAINFALPHSPVVLCKFFGESAA